MGTLHDLAAGRIEQPLEPAESPVLSDREEAEAVMRAVSASLKRQRSRFGQPCHATALVFDAISEMDVGKASYLTDLLQHGAEYGSWDDSQIGRLIREQVIGRVRDAIDVDAAVADMLEAGDE